MHIDSVDLEKCLRFPVSSKLEGDAIAVGLLTLSSKASTLKFYSLLQEKRVRVRPLLCNRSVRSEGSFLLMTFCNDDRKPSFSCLAYWGN